MKKKDISDSSFRIRVNTNNVEDADSSEMVQTTEPLNKSKKRDQYKENESTVDVLPVEMDSQ